MATYRYAAVGRCIYCGTTDLTPGARRFGDEHIVPLALNGALVLSEASCRHCERTINREIEDRLLSEEWAHFRTRYGLPTRRPKSRAKTVSLACRTGDHIKVPANEYTAPVPLYRFSTARILSGSQPIPNSQAWTIAVLSDGDEEARLQRRYPLWNGEHSIRPEPYRFARFIAKIGYSFAVAEMGLYCFRPLVRGIILGRSDDYFRFVGSAPREPPPTGWPRGGKHHFDITIRSVQDGIGLVVVDVKLFAEAGTPVYHAVVGEIDAKNPGHFAALEHYRSAGRLALLPNGSGHGGPSPRDDAGG